MAEENISRHAKNVSKKNEQVIGVSKELEFLILQDLLDLEDETKSDEEEEEEEVNCLKEQ